MIKLLDAYRNSKTLKNAQKIRAYGRAHPFSACLLDRAYAGLLAEAIHHANLGMDMSEHQIHLENLAVSDRIIAQERQRLGDQLFAKRAADKCGFAHRCAPNSPSCSCRQWAQERI